MKLAITMCERNTRGAPLRGLLIALEPAPSASVEAIYCGGHELVLEANLTRFDGGAAGPFDLSKVNAVEVAIEEVGASGELWGDVSLLTLPSAKRAKPGDAAEGSRATRVFSFDWLFTGENGGSLPAAEAVTVAQLQSMIEAQARVISVGPPVPIEHDEKFRIRTKR